MQNIKHNSKQPTRAHLSQSRLPRTQNSLFHMSAINWTRQRSVTHSSSCCDDISRLTDRTRQSKQAMFASLVFARGRQPFTPPRSDQLQQDKKMHPRKTWGHAEEEKDLHFSITFQLKLYLRSRWRGPFRRPERFAFQPVDAPVRGGAALRFEDLLIE